MKFLTAISLLLFISAVYSDSNLQKQAFEIREGFEVISSIESLREKMAQSGGKIRMKPGIYEVQEAESGTTYNVSLPDDFPDYATDLVTGTGIDLRGGNIQIKPYTTMVLDKSLPQFCGDDNTVYMQGDLNRDCKVNLLDLVEFANLWLM